MANPAGAVSAWPGFVCVLAGSSRDDEAPVPQEVHHARRHPQVHQPLGRRQTEARPKLQHLEQTMRGTPGFVAYYFLETDDGIATITITEDEAGTTESMSRAANWVQQNLESRASLGQSRGHHRRGPDQRHPLARCCGDAS